MPHFPERVKDVYGSETTSNKNVSSMDGPECGTASSHNETAKAETNRDSPECESIERLLVSVQMANPDKSLMDLRVILNQQRELIDKLLVERLKISQLDVESGMSGIGTKSKVAAILNYFKSFWTHENRTDFTSQRDHAILDAKVEMKDYGTQTEFLCNADEVLHDVRDIQHLQDECMYLYDENDKLKAELKKAKHGSTDCENSETNTGSESVKLRENLGEEDKKKAKPVQEAPILVVKPIIKNLDVQIHSTSSSGEMVSSMEEAMKREITTRMSSHHVHVNFMMVTVKGKLHEPSVIICPIFSRIGTDVDAALSGFANVGSGTLLLVIHNKEEHNLPKVKSENLLSRYNRLGAILDMAYRKDKGFYSTSFNELSFGFVVNFLLKYVDNN